MAWMCWVKSQGVWAYLFIGPGRAPPFFLERTRFSYQPSSRIASDLLKKKAFFFLPSPGMQPAGRLHLHLHLVLRPVPFPGRPRSVSPVLSPLISLDTHFILRHQTKDVTIDRCLML